MSDSNFGVHLEHFSTLLTEIYTFEIEVEFLKEAKNDKKWQFIKGVSANCMRGVNKTPKRIFLCIM